MDQKIKFSLKSSPDGNEESLCIVCSYFCTSIDDQKNSF